MSTRPRYFLLDAGPVIELHRLGLWSDVLQRCEIVVPEIIARREARYWLREDGSVPLIDVMSDADAGRVTLYECSPEDLHDTFALFDAVTRQSVDPGELHALTALRLWGHGHRPRFCSADRMAVVCLCLLGFADLGVSLEEILGDVGLGRQLDRQYRRLTLADWVAEGRERRMRGQGLA